MKSGDTSLMKGNCDACAMVAANAVFPDPGGPDRVRTHASEKELKINNISDEAYRVRGD